jgi:hypothetical protein
MEASETVAGKTVAWDEGEQHDQRVSSRALWSAMQQRNVRLPDRCRSSETSVFVDFAQTAPSPR